MTAAKGGDSFSDMTAVLKKFDTYPGEEAKAAITELQAKSDELLEKAKTELRELISSTDPVKIDEEMKTAETNYGEAIAEEKKVRVSCW